MDWMNVLQQVFEIAIFPLLGAATLYLTFLVNTKIQELKQKTKDETTRKYLDMLNVTISNTVLATTQTYVESLKKEGKFDSEAQAIAFNNTYDAIMQTLTEESKKYINELVGDVQLYVTNRIEAEVQLNKMV